MKDKIERLFEQFLIHPELEYDYYQFTRVELGAIVSQIEDFQSKELEALREEGL